MKALYQSVRSAIGVLRWIRAISNEPGTLGVSKSEFSMRSKVGYGGLARVLIAGVLLAGLSVAVQAAWADNQGANPFTAVMDKLNEILTDVRNISKEGNHTLRWDTNHPAGSRFVVLDTFANAAALDKNTGLVWEQTPDLTKRDWFSAAAHCINRTVGGTFGWRLPSIVELVSVMDPTLSAPYVPTDVFTFTGPLTTFWSSTTNASFPANAWYFDITIAGVPQINKGAGISAWCVRGPMNADAY